MGALIGAIGGLAFVLVNSGSLPPALVVPVRILGVLGFLAVIGFVVIRPWARERPDRPPRPSGLRIYLISVAAMVVLLPVGAAVLGRSASLSGLQLPWVVFIVGAHFLPLAIAYRAWVFAWLGGAMVLTAVVGALVVLTTGPQTAGWTGVAAGLELLMASVWPAVQRRLRLSEPVRPP